MRLLVGFCILIMIVCGYGGGIQDCQQPDAITALARELPKWANHEIFGPRTLAVQAQLETYYRWRDEAEAIAQKKVLRLTIIGQTHKPPIIVDIGHQQILTSQTNVYRWLLRIRPDILIDEGSSHGPTTLLDKLKGVGRKKRGADLALDGTLHYSAKNPHLPVWGSESLPLLELQIKVYDIDFDIEEMTVAQYADLDRLGRSLLNARSQIAVDLAVISLDTSGKEHAALVIGRNHRQVCVQESLRLGLKTVYHTANTYTLLKK